MERRYLRLGAPKVSAHRPPIPGHSGILETGAGHLITSFAVGQLPPQKILLLARWYLTVAFAPGPALSKPFKTKIQIDRLGFGVWISDEFWSSDFGEACVLHLAPHMGPVGISDFRFWIRTLDFGFRILNLDLDFLPRFGFCTRFFCVTLTRAGGWICSWEAPGQEYNRTENVLLLGFTMTGFTGQQLLSNGMTHPLNWGHCASV